MLVSYGLGSNCSERLKGTEAAMERLYIPNMQGLKAGVLTQCYGMYQHYFADGSPAYAPPRRWTLQGGPKDPREHSDFDFNIRTRIARRKNWPGSYPYVAVALRAEDLPDRYPIPGEETAA